MKNKLIVFLLAAAALLILPFIAQYAGNVWVRMIDFALLYVLLALGLNIVVGYAGLLDLGYVAFYAVGAYVFGLLASPHLGDTFPAIKAIFPNGLHTPFWVVIPLGAALAGLAGVMLGAPTLKLRGDYLAIVTLGFGEIIRVFVNNLDRPINITNGPKGLSQIDSIKMLGETKPWKVANITPETPPKVAPMPKASSFRLRVLMPMALAAISSSRMAIQARPMRERSNR